MASEYEGSTKLNPVQITEGMHPSDCCCSCTDGGRVFPLHVPHSFLVDEAAVYDRQIRLWGLDAQQR